MHKVGTKKVENHTYANWTILVQEIQFWEFMGTGGANLAQFSTN